MASYATEVKQIDIDIIDLHQGVGYTVRKIKQEALEQIPTVAPYGMKWELEGLSGVLSDEHSTEYFLEGKGTRFYMDAYYILKDSRKAREEFRYNMRKAWAAFLLPIAFWGILRLHLFRPDLIGYPVEVTYVC